MSQLIEEYVEKGDVDEVQEIHRENCFRNSTFGQLKEELIEIGKYQVLSLKSSTIADVILLKKSINSSYFKVFITISFNFQNQRIIQLSATIYFHDRCFLLVTKSQRLKFLSYLLNLNRIAPEISSSVNMDNGEIYLKNNHLNFNKNNFLSPNHIIPFILTQIESLLTFSKKVIQIIQFFDGQMKKNHNVKVNHPKIQKYSKLLTKIMSLSFYDFGVSKPDEPNPIFSNNQNKKQKQLFINHVNTNINRDNFQSLLLFSHKYKKIQLVKKNDYEFSFDDTIEIENFLQFPSPRLRNFSENQFICNQIKILNENSLIFRKSINGGGVGNLQVGLVSFQYLQNNQNDEENPLLSLQKSMAIKKAKHIRFQKFIQHEKKIVSMLMYQCSAYVIKYYKPKHHQTLKNQLMMDFYPRAHTLNSYLYHHSKVLRFETKMIIFSKIVNGLRFFKKKQIVHMDLNFNNILIIKPFNVKIIDFGNAYHPEVCHKNNQYEVGFTNPFGPPEIFNKIKKFNHKSDIFSLGIILFYLIFDRFPFQPTERLKKSFKDKTHLDKFLFAPENIEYVGDQTITTTLFILFNRMIQTQVLTRPYSTWVKVIYGFLDAFKKENQKLIAYDQYYINY